MHELKGERCNIVAHLKENREQLRNIHNLDTLKQHKVVHERKYNQS